MGQPSRRRFHKRQDIPRKMPGFVVPYILMVDEIARWIYIM